MSLIMLRDVIIGDVVNYSPKKYGYGSNRPNATVVGKRCDIVCLGYRQKEYGLYAPSELYKFDFTEDNYIKNIKDYVAFLYLYDDVVVDFIGKEIINADNVCVICKRSAPHVKLEYICKSCEVELCL